MNNFSNSKFCLTIWLIAISDTFVETVTISCNYNISFYSVTYEIEGVRKKITYITDAYICFKAKVSYECDTSEDVAGVSNNHINGKLSDDVQMLRFVQEKLAKLPKRIENFFPNLESISAYDTQLQEISSDVLKFPKLRGLFLNLNQLKTLPGNLFEHTPNLEYFWFHKNQIETIGLNIFKSLKKLVDVDSQENICTTTSRCCLAGGNMDKHIKRIIDDCTPRRRFGLWQPSTTEVMEIRTAITRGVPNELHIQNKSRSNETLRRNFVQTEEACQKNYEFIPSRHKPQPDGHN